MKTQKKILVGLVATVLFGLTILIRPPEKFVLSFENGIEQQQSSSSPLNAWKGRRGMSTNEVKTVSMRVGSDVTDERMILCGRYTCNIQRGGDPGKADLSMFNRESVEHYQTPPQRRPGELWVFQSMELQWLHTDYLSSWDRMFNYSSTYLQGSQVLSHFFGKQLVKTTNPTTINFAQTKTVRKATALWTASDCTLANRPATGSARIMYAMELSEHIEIDMFATNDACARRMQSSFKNHLLKSEPAMRNYTFYLAFENTLCKNYITQNLWKVLGARTYTIPVVLGGLSIEEYTKVAPPNSFIHVKNFTSPKALADHLKYVAENDDAFNYYLQWRNEYEIQKVGSSSNLECYYCKLAHEKPAGRWDTFSKDFGSHNCIDISAPSDFCSYYNLKCYADQGQGYDQQ